MAHSIALIGPGCAGKSTISRLLAEALGWKAIELDHEREQYRIEMGYDADLAKEIRREQGFEGLAAYWKPFDIHCVERVLEDYPTDCVIAFGAGNSVYDDPERFQRAKDALAPLDHVVLLEPSPVHDECIHILDERLHKILDQPTAGLLRVNHSFVGHPCNKELATMTFYNGEETPLETTRRILATIQDHR